MKYGHEKCQYGACDHGAKIVPKLCVPPKGVRADVTKDMSGILGFKLCEECFEKFRTSSDVAGIVRDFMPAFTILSGGIPPDFENAYLVRVLISSKEYQNFDTIKAESEKRKATIH